MLVTQTALPYILKDVDPDHPKRVEAVLGLQRAVKAVLEAESPHDIENRNELNVLKELVLEALCMFERYAPVSERALCFHYFTHMPDFLHRWGSARNLWSYFGERYTFFARCIHIQL